jgi:hypothetical protein
MRPGSTSSGAASASPPASAAVSGVAARAGSVIWKAVLSASGTGGPDGDPPDREGDHQDMGGDVVVKRPRGPSSIIGRPATSGPMIEPSP